MISTFFSAVGFFSCQIWVNGICFYKWYFSNNQNIEIFSCFHSSSRWLQVFFIMKFALYWKLACWVFALEHWHWKPALLTLKCESQFKLFHEKVVGLQDLFFEKKSFFHWISTQFWTQFLLSIFQTAYDSREKNV